MHVAVSLPQAVSAQRAPTSSREGCGTSRRRPSRNVELKTANGRQHVARPNRDTKRERDSTHTTAPRTQDGLEFNPPVFLDVRKACAGKKVLIMGLPGAFTPC